MRMKFLREIVFICITLWQGCCGGDEQSTSSGKKCDIVQLDLVIVLDSSGSVTTVNFEKTKDFIQNIISQLPVQADAIRIGVVRYATNADVITYLNEDMDQREKSAVLQKMEYRPGATKTHIALQMTERIVLTPERGDRPDVPDLVILITDGVSVNQMFTRREADLLKERPDLKILVIGIGNTLNDEELLAVASSPQMVHRVTSFSKLHDIVESLATLTCSDTLHDSESTTSSSSHRTASTYSVTGLRRKTTRRTPVFYRVSRPSQKMNLPSILPPTIQKKEPQPPTAKSPISTFTSSTSVSSSSSPISSSSSLSLPHMSESQSAVTVATTVLTSPSSKTVLSSSSSSSTSSSSSSSISSSSTSATELPSITLSPTTKESDSTTRATSSIAVTTVFDPEVTTIIDLGITANHTDITNILQPSSSSTVPTSPAHVHEHTSYDKELDSPDTTDFRKLSKDSTVEKTPYLYISSSSLSYTTTTLPSNTLASSMTNHYVSDTLDGQSAHTPLTSTLRSENDLHPKIFSSSATTSTLHLTISPTAAATVDASSEQLDLFSMSTRLPTPILPSEDFVTDPLRVSSTSLISHNSLEPERKIMPTSSAVSHKPSYTPVSVSQTSALGKEDNNITTTGLYSHHKQDENTGKTDVASSDIYMFVAAGAAGAVILTAATICMALLCRKRTRGGVPDA